MGIEEIKNGLDKNKVLTDEVKADLFELILIFHKNYKDVSLTLLAQRLETVKIEVVGKFINKEVVTYNDKTNTIQINKAELEKTNNTKHILMTSLIHMMIPSDKDPKGLLEALTHGYARIVANNLVGSEAE